MSPCAAKASREGGAVVHAPALLFPGGVFSQTAVDGPARGAPSAAGQPAPPAAALAGAAPPAAGAAALLPDVAPEIRERIEQLLLAEKHESGGALADKLRQLDIVLFAALMPRALQCFFLRVVRIEHLPGRAPVRDIGNIVRRLMLKWGSKDVLFRMYQYSMPFVKHNRLQFPAFEHTSMQEMHHMLHVVQNLTLGVQQGAAKMPVWTTRLQLLRFFHNLLSRGSSMDLYVFLSSHMYLLRLALIENFITFSNTCMPLEVSLMRCFVDSSYDHARVSRLVRYIVDNFRMTALQEDLDFARLEAKAQVAIERCNRTCRSMQNINGPHEAQRALEFDRRVFAEALRAPRLGGIHGLQLLHAASERPLLQLAAMHDMQSRIMRYPLPVELQQQQFQFMAASADALQGIHRRSVLHVCLRCHDKHLTAPGNMRVVHGDSPMCVHCSSNQFTAAVQTLGCIVRVQKTSYYFCHFCAAVHAWTGSPESFYKCVLEQRRPRAHVSRACGVCYRAQTTSSVSVFDARLGVQSTVWLCARHLPSAVQLAYVYDIASLKRLVAHKARA